MAPDRPILLFALGLFAATLGPARAGDPPAAPKAPPKVSLVFTAGDAARLAEGVRLPRADTYTVKVWAPASQDWSIASDSPALTLRLAPGGGGAAPRWKTLGTAALKGETLKVVVATPGADAAKAKEKADAPRRKARGEAPAAPASPVPPVLVLSTDPDYKADVALDLIRGRLDSAEPSPDPRRATVRTNQQGVEFRPPADERAWRDRARAVRERLLVAEGLWPMPPRTPLNPRWLGKLERDGYTIEKVALETLPGFTLGGNLYRPVGKTGKLPAVLCPHGHWSDGRVNPEVQQRCIRLAKLGFVVFMYDMVGYNDSKPFGHEFLNDRLRRWGLSLVSLQTWDSLRALDWVTSLPDVDPARIACTGESGGGTQTFLLTAIDSRVAVAAPIVMVSDAFQGGCVCENCAGLRWGTDNVEIAALAAPRPMKMVGATGDWTARTMTKAYPAIRGVYALLGKPERLSADVFNFEHNYNQTSRNAVYPFLAHWLMGLDDPEATAEGAQTVEKPEDLWVFGGTPPSTLKTPAQLENDLIHTLSGQLATLAPGASADPATWQAAREFLATSHRVRVGLVNPPPAAIEATEVRKTTHGELPVVHLRVGRKGSGEGVPVVRMSPKKPSGRLTVLAFPRGKSALAEHDGPSIPLVKALLNRGQSVVLFDPLFVGENADPTRPASRRPDTAHYDTYNPSLAADQMQDLATVLAWARALPDVLEVSVAGVGRSGAQVLLARPLLEGVARTAVDLDGFDPGDGSAALPAELDLPGLLQFGGTKAAAALAAPAPLWIARAGKALDRSWPEKAYALAGVPHLLKIDAGEVTPEALARWIDTGE